METKLGFESKLAENDTVFHEAREEMFDLYGLYNSQNEKYYRRMPADIAESVSAGVAELVKHSAGGRLRFKTDSPYIIIKADLEYTADMSHFPRSGASSFDFYIKRGTKFIFNNCFIQYDFERGKNDKGYEGKVCIHNGGVNEILINFPSYSVVNNLYIGVKDGSVLTHGDKYRFTKPVVYYGSSITQGACSSRPGNTYEQIISNDLDCDYINLGFSGAALGEDNMADYISSLDMSVFVMDYDHNAPGVDHLEKTHERFFKKIRNAHPDLPIVLVTRPTVACYDYGQPLEASMGCLPRIRDYLLTRNVILQTYTNAIEAGDKNVAFIDGMEIFNGPHADLCTVDGTHPNDAGFFRMADRIGAIISQMIR